MLLSDHYEIFTKEGTLEGLILTKFRNDRVKIEDFLVKTYFWPSPETTGTQCNERTLVALKINPINSFLFIGYSPKILTEIIVFSY